MGSSPIQVAMLSPQPFAGMAQLVEHILGKDEVISSILITSSKANPFVSNYGRVFWLFKQLFI